MRQPPGGKVISIGGYNQTKVVVAAGPVFFYIEIQKGNLALAGDTILENEVARIDMTPLEEERMGTGGLRDGGGEGGEKRAKEDSDRCQVKKRSEVLGHTATLHADGGVRRDNTRL